jgi:hypothetical protein
MAGIASGFILSDIALMLGVIGAMVRLLSFPGNEILAQLAR